MSFFFTGTWGMIWMAALAVAGVITLLGDDINLKRALLCIVLSWLITRTLVTFYPDAVLAHSINDAAAFVALVLFTRADAVAFLYFCIFQLGVFASLGIINRVANYAMADALGFIALFCMAGGSHLGGSGLAARLGIVRLGDALRGLAFGKWL